MAICSAGGQLIGVYLTRSDATTEMRYFHSDRLGSLTLITNAAGAQIERLAYEAYGKRRYPNGADDPASTLYGVTTDRGYTGHEHLDEVALVHMNGRIYDPLLGKFMTPDPFIQAPALTVSYNRYAYGFDNPLSGVDPSGYGFFSDLFSPVTDAWHSVWRSDVGRVAVTVAVAYWTGGAVSSWLGNAAVASGGSTAFANVTFLETEGILVPTSLTAAGSATVAAGAGFAGGYLASGGDFQTGLRGAASGAIFGGVDGYYGNSWSLERVAANSVAGGISSRIQGGSFADGFASRFGLSALTYANYLMRQEMIRSSLLDPDSGNAGGKSAGFFGDLFKLGGARFVDGLTCDSPLGGCQGGPGRIGPFSYSPGSFGDRLVEAYAGPHDYLNSWYWYDDLGNGRNLSGLRGWFGEALNALNVVPATPFAAAGLIQTSGFEATLNTIRSRNGR